MVCILEESFPPPWDRRNITASNRHLSSLLLWSNNYFFFRKNVLNQCHLFLQGILTDCQTLHPFLMLTIVVTHSLVLLQIKLGVRCWSRVEGQFWSRKNTWLEELNSFLLLVLWPRMELGTPIVGLSIWKLWKDLIFQYPNWLDPESLLVKLHGVISYL